VSLRDLYAQYSDTVQFLVIYIREAHPTDGWDIGSDVRTQDPCTIEERRAVAGECESALQHGIHTYVDEMHDPVMTAYAAWPERLYLVDEAGQIAYAGGLGPFGFDPAALQQAIETMLARRVPTPSALPKPRIYPRYPPSKKQRPNFFCIVRKHSLPIVMACRCPTLKSTLLTTGFG